MLTEKEENFMEYWEKARKHQKKFLYQLGVGLPVGLLFGTVIIANFYAGWYKRADMISNSRFNPIVLYVAVILIAVFVAIFSKKFQYDQLEQRFKELKSKKDSDKTTLDHAANDAVQES